MDLTPTDMEMDASTSTSSTAGASLLARLHAPSASDLSRKRVIHASKLPMGKKRSVYCSKHDPKGVSPSQRVKEFPDENLTVSAGKLFSRATHS